MAVTTADMLLSDGGFLVQDPEPPARHRPTL